MKKQKSTKRALLMSALSLLMCVSMLVGTTFAWFTDSVTSGSNVIKSGSLDVTMEWKDATATGAQQKYIDASTGPIFNYDKWEPGYVEAKNVKISNVGTLALKYALNIFANGEVSILANVIDVYYAEEELTLADRDLSKLTNVGTLADVLKGMPANTSGNLLAGESDTVTIALKMQESAGNKYQNLSIGTDFSIQLLATQYNHEEDSFGSDYDEGLDPSVTYVYTPEQLQAAVKYSGKIVLMDDISLDSSAEFMATNGNGSLLDLNRVHITLDLNGHNIVAEADALVEGKTAATALFLVHRSTLNIVGEGELITENQSIPVYGWLESEINIYGGTFKGNAYQRNESDVYVNNDTVTINVYGGNFSESVYAFNAHDTSANAPVIILHEGVTYKDFFKNGTNNLITNDMNAGRIKLAENCSLAQVAIDGETWNQVVKGTVVSTTDELNAAINSAKDGDTIYLNAGTYNTALNLQGKSLTIQGAGKDKTVIAGPEDYTTSNIPMQSWAGWSGQDANVYALISANKDVTIKNLTVKADPEEIFGETCFKDQPDYAFVGIHVQSANATIENVNIEGIKPAEVTGNDHHNFGLYITTAIGDTNAYTATYKNGTVSDVNRGGIYCWSGNYTLNFEDVTVVGPGSPTNPNDTLTPAAGSENNNAIYAFCSFYVCSPATYKNVNIQDTYAVAWWGGASWNFSGNCAQNAPDGVTCSNCGAVY